MICHRFGGDGGATGPDLSQVAGRFGLKDLAESIVEPSKVIPDQYKASVVRTTFGKTYVGMIVNDANGKYTIVIDPEDSTKVVEVKKDDVRGREAVEHLAHAGKALESHERKRSPGPARLSLIARGSQPSDVQAVVAVGSSVQQNNHARESSIVLNEH